MTEAHTCCTPLARKSSIESTLSRLIVKLQIDVFRQKSLITCHESHIEVHMFMQFTSTRFRSDCQSCKKSRKMGGWWSSIKAKFMNFKERTVRGRHRTAIHMFIEPRNLVCSSTVTRFSDANGLISFVGMLPISRSCCRSLLRRTKQCSAGTSVVSRAC